MTFDLSSMQPIGLARLELTAALQTRRDRKYIVPLEAVGSLLGDLDGGDIRVLEIGGRRNFRYETVYFDTPDLACYRAAARRRPRRFKVRTRRYRDGGTTFLEAKVRRQRGLTVKHRFALEGAEHGRLTPTGLAHLQDVEGVGEVARQLGPTLTTRYSRSTVLSVAPPVRLTIDTGLEFVVPDGASLDLPGMAIVETKSAGPPTAFDRLLWAYGHRPVSISKYGTGLAALDPTLAANRWHRVLRDHFGRGDDPEQRAPVRIGGANPALGRAMR